MTFSNFSEFTFEEMGDPRVHNWPLMSSLWYHLAILAIYAFVIFALLPAYMANRKPYSLKNIIAGYNLFQVAYCIVLVYGVLNSGWTLNYVFGCQCVDFSENEMSMKMAKWFWLNMILKLIELVETIFFALRKKWNQISMLHVYHHMTSAVMAWLACKWAPGGLPAMTIVLNSSVHVVMYTYYFFSSLGPNMQKKLNGFKSKITLLQLAQLCLLLLHCSQTLLPSCKCYPWIYPMVYIPNMVFNISMFLNFYKNAYMKKIKTPVS